MKSSSFDFEMSFQHYLSLCSLILATKSNHVYWSSEQCKLLQTTKNNYSKSIRVGYDRVEQIREGVSEHGLEGNFWKEGLPPCIQSQRECLHGWSVHNLLWQLGPALDHSNAERMLTATGFTPLLVNLESMTSKLLIIFYYYSSLHKLKQCQKDISKSNELLITYQSYPTFIRIVFLLGKSSGSAPLTSNRI